MALREECIPQAQPAQDRAACRRDRFADAPLRAHLCVGDDDVRDSVRGQGKRGGAAGRTAADDDDGMAAAADECLLGQS